MWKKLRMRLLTNKRQQWAKNRKGKFKGSALKIGVSIQNRYAKKLDRITRMMVDDVNRQVKKLFVSDDARKYFAQDASISSQSRILMNQLEEKYDSLFSQISKPFANQMVNQVDKDSKSSLHSSLEKLSGGLSIKTDFITGDLEEELKAIVSENVELIKSIPSQYFNQVKGMVYRSITSRDEGGLSGIIKKLDNNLDKRNKQILNKAKNLALDQTRKAYNHFNAARMEKAGVKRFEWVHTGGGQTPRKYHRDELNGKIFSLDDPPIIDKNTGERGLPGDAINCRCTMLPVLEFGEN